MRPSTDLLGLLPQYTRPPTRSPHRWRGPPAQPVAKGKNRARLSKDHSS